MAEFFQQHGADIVTLTMEHIQISLLALFLGLIVAVPAGLILTRLPKVADVVMSLAGLFQTIPTLALLALMIPFLGIGKVPATIALFIYSLLPIMRNTYIGIEGVDRDLKDAAKGQGMTDWEVITQVEIPMAMPIIMAGVRLSAVYVISWATLAAYIGGGGLGEIIFVGLDYYDIGMILGGTIPVTVLALLADYLLGLLEKRLDPMASIRPSGS